MQHTKMGHVALVAGASGELGQAFCDLLIVHGYDVIAADIRPFQPANENTQRACSAGRVRLQFLDVRAEDSWRHAVRTWQPIFPQLQLLVNAAGVLSAGHFTALSPTTWNRDIDVNLRGTILGCQTCSNWLRSGDVPAGIINISSCAAFLPLPWSSVYNATKAGVLAFSESLAEEWRSTNCRITVACPGFFGSNLFAVDSIEDPSLAQLLRKITNRSSLTASEVVAAVWAGHHGGQRLVLSPRQLRWWYRWKRWFPQSTNRLVGTRAWARYARVNTGLPSAGH